MNRQISVECLKSSQLNPLTEGNEIVVPRCLAQSISLSCLFQLGKKAKTLSTCCGFYKGISTRLLFISNYVVCLPYYNLQSLRAGTKSPGC